MTHLGAVKTGSRPPCHSITSSARASSEGGTAERLRGLEIEDKPQLGGALHRQIGGLGAPQYLSGIDTDLTKGVTNARSVVHKAAHRREFAPRVDRWDLMARRQRDDLMTMAAPQGVDADL
jgi:hypothetical protein